MPGVRREGRTGPERAAQGIVHHLEGVHPARRRPCPEAEPVEERPRTGVLGQRLPAVSHGMDEGRRAGEARAGLEDKREGV